MWGNKKWYSIFVPALSKDNFFFIIPKRVKFFFLSLLEINSSTKMCVQNAILMLKFISSIGRDDTQLLFFRDCSKNSKSSTEVAPKKFTILLKKLKQKMKKSEEIKEINFFLLSSSFLFRRWRTQPLLRWRNWRLLNLQNYISNTVQIVDS